MPTVNLSIGTTAVYVASIIGNQLLDILIQNLSANNVYVGSSDGVTTSNGIKIAPNAVPYSNDKRKEPVWLIADGAASDVRVTVEKYVLGEK